MAGRGAVVCAEEPGNAEAHLWAHPARQIGSQAGDCIETAPWQREEAGTRPWVAGEAGCSCGGLVLGPAGKRQKPLRALRRTASAIR